MLLRHDGVVEIMKDCALIGGWVQFINFIRNGIGYSSDRYAASANGWCVTPPDATDGQTSKMKRWCLRLYLSFRSALAPLPSNAVIAAAFLQSAATWSAVLPS